jgi:hypothetical protein
MRADDLHRRWRLDVVFGLFLASGLTVGVVCLLAIRNWLYPQGEGAFGIFYLAVFSLAPAFLSCLAGGMYLLLMDAGDREVRLGVALTTAHVVGWLMVIVVELSREDPTWSGVMRVAALLEPSLYGVAAMFLGARWFWWRRPHGSVQASA